MPRAKVTKKAGNNGTKKKTTRRKATASTRSKTSTPKATTSTRKRTTRKTSTRKSDIVGSDDERRRLIAEAAYLRAEARGFVGGDPTSDWLAAESEIDSRFAYA